MGDIARINKKLTVSVVIPNYNYGRFLSETIESVLAQTYPCKEIIVVDDGSTDDSLEILALYEKTGVNVIKQKNRGVGAARNAGANASSGDLLAFLDADDIWEPTKIEKQFAKIAKSPEVGLVHCGMREFDGETGKTVRLYTDGKEGWIADALLLWEGPVIVGPGGTVMVSKKAFDEVGGFDARIKVGEDWDFCYRVARKYKVGFVSEVLVNYRSHGKNAHKNVTEMDRGMTLFYKKVFNTDDKKILKLKGRALGNFQQILSGSYFHAGKYWKFLEHAAQSVWHRPRNFWYFVAFPLRRFGAWKKSAVTFGGSRNKL